MLFFILFFFYLFFSSLQIQIHCSVLKDCSQTFYFSKHTREKVNEVSPCTKHEEVAKNGVGGRGGGGAKRRGWEGEGGKQD